MAREARTTRREPASARQPKGEPMSPSARATADDFAAARERLGAIDATPKAKRAKSTRTLEREARRVPAELAPKVPGRKPQNGRPRGSTLPEYLQLAIRLGLEAGHSVNSIALDLRVSHDAVRVVRDGFSQHSSGVYAKQKAKATAPTRKARKTK